MLLSLSWKYFLLVFIAVLGVLQGASARNNLRTLQFFSYKPASYTFAVITIGLSLFIFFNWNSRYATSVIEGAEQVGLFTMGGAAALACTLFVSSAIRSTFVKRFRPRRFETHQVVRHRGFPSLNRAASSQILRNRANGRH